MDTQRVNLITSYSSNTLENEISQVLIVVGVLKYLLEMEMTRSSIELSISQRKYVLDFLKETGMLASKPLETPMDANVKLGEDHSDLPMVDKMRYQRLVGKTYISVAHVP